MHLWSTSLVLSAAAVTIFGVWLWKQKKKRIYIKVGNVSKLFFFPFKSLKAVEVTSGICTKLGFVVDGFLDRSFMLVDKDNTLVSQRQAPKLVFLTPNFSENYVIISGPDLTDLKIEVKHEISSNDSIRECCVHRDVIPAVDCGDSAAAWFQKYLDRSDIRCVQFFPGLPNRKYILKDPFFIKSRKENPIAFQDGAPFHLMSQPSIDDLNSRIDDEKVSVLNFRPNVLVEGCQPFDEDTWKFMKFPSGAEFSIILPCDRCLMTTNNPETANLTMKEPLVTLRKYRVPKDPRIAKLVRNIPCLGVFCRVTKIGEINVGDEIFAVIEDL